MLWPDFYVLANDEHWTMTPEAHNYAAARSFCFVATENGEQPDIYIYIKIQLDNSFKVCSDQCASRK